MTPAEQILQKYRDTPVSERLKAAALNGFSIVLVLPIVKLKLVSSLCLLLIIAAIQCR